MPLTLLGKSLLVQIRPSGARDYLDLDSVLANFDGSFALVGDGKGNFSRSADDVRLEGGSLVALLHKCDKTAIEISFDLERAGIVTDRGLGLPSYIRDAAVQTTLPYAQRSELPIGRTNAKIRQAMKEFDRTQSTRSAFRLCNASEQRALYYLGRAERELLRVAGRKCHFAQIMPGWLEEDDKTLWVKPRFDKLGVCRDYNCLIRLEPGRVAQDYPTVFVLALKVIEDGLRSFQGQTLPGFTECHLRDAETHIRRSLVVRNTQLKKYTGRSYGSRDRQVDFFRQLQEACLTLIKMTDPPKLSDDLTTKAARPTSVSTASVPATPTSSSRPVATLKVSATMDVAVAKLIEVDDYDLEDDSVQKGDNPFF